MEFLAGYSNLFEDVTALLIIGLQIVTVILASTLIYEKVTKTAPGKLTSFFGENGILLAFLVTLGATLGSLYFSEIALYPPCKLCWFQRIFIFPQALILLVALYKKDYGVRIYSMTLAFVGILFSVYHYTIETFQIETSTCGVGGNPSCSQRVFLEYGYISLAMMALTVSLFVLVVMINLKKTGEVTG